MTLPNGIQFLEDVTNAYQCLEAKCASKLFKIASRQNLHILSVPFHF